MTYAHISIAGVLVAVVALLGFATIVSAHGANTVDPEAPNCMGLLTSSHAKEGGIKKSAETWPHTGIGGPHDGTVKGHQKLFKAYCDSDEDSDDDAPGDPGDQQ